MVLSFVARQRGCKDKYRDNFGIWFLRWGGEDVAAFCVLKNYCIFAVGFVEGEFA